MNWLTFPISTWGSHGLVTLNLTLPLDQRSIRKILEETIKPNWNNNKFQSNLFSKLREFGGPAFSDTEGGLNSSLNPPSLNFTTKNLDFLAKSCPFSLVSFQINMVELPQF